MEHDPARPALSLRTREADAGSAATDLAAQLQRGLETADADTYDAWFGADILWGSPYGATLTGYDELNAIHRGLMARGTAPPSRFEVVTASAPAPDVVVTHIRRRALAEDGFSEMALYVLIRRDGAWWLAAAQNTPVVTTRAASGSS